MAVCIGKGISSFDVYIFTSLLFRVTRSNINHCCLVMEFGFHLPILTCPASVCILILFTLTRGNVRDDSNMKKAWWRWQKICTWSDVSFEILTAVTMKNFIFWDVMLRSPVEVHRCFRGTCYLRLEGQRVRQASSHLSLQLASCWLLDWLGLIFNLEDRNTKYHWNISEFLLEYMLSQHER